MDDVNATQAMIRNNCTQITPSFFICFILFGKYASLTSASGSTYTRLQLPIQLEHVRKKNFVVRAGNAGVGVVTVGVFPHTVDLQATTSTRVGVMSRQ